MHRAGMDAEGRTEVEGGPGEPRRDMLIRWAFRSARSSSLKAARAGFGVDSSRIKRRQRPGRSRGSEREKERREGRLPC